MSKRDAAYYKARLERDHPRIHADLIDGKYATVRAAAIAAGLVKPRSPLLELQNAWRKATPREREEFAYWVNGSASGVRLTSSSPSPPVAVNRYLQPWAKHRIEEIMSRRGLESGDMMDELGFRRLNGSFGNAMSQGTRLRPEMIAALEKWLEANKAV